MSETCLNCDRNLSETCPKPVRNLSEGKKMEDPIRQHILNELSENGRMRKSEIVATMPDAARKIKTRLSDMTKEGSIESPKRGYYVLPATSAQAALNQQLNEISNALRSPDANKNTIDRLLNIYDGVLDNYEAWVLKNVGSETDFEQQLRFIENFKWLTAIGDKLMKRWSLEHVGYDTNTRQAQEDAKAKTAEKEKQALENAPLEESIVVVGHYQEGMQEILANLPKKEVEETSV